MVHVGNTGRRAELTTSFFRRVPGALSSWSFLFPLILDTLERNIHFQCADAFTLPFNILTPGVDRAWRAEPNQVGHTKWSGANNYSGSTVVSKALADRSVFLFPPMGAVIPGWHSRFSIIQ